MNKIVLNKIYRHFKGDYYIVLDIAYDADTLKEYVVYRALYGDNKLWIRPKDEFLSKVDRDKYPNIKQKYRFEVQNIKSVNNKV